MQQRLAVLALDLVYSEMMVEKNAKDMIWHRKSYKKQGINGMRIVWNGLILSTKYYVEKMRQGHISTILMKKCLSTIEYLQKKIKSLPPEPQSSDFYHASEAQKIGALLFVTVGIGIATYALYKYLK